MASGDRGHGGHGHGDVGDVVVDGGLRAGCVGAVLPRVEADSYTECGWD